jgi:hypothetical protein
VMNIAETLWATLEPVSVRAVSHCC